MKWRGFTLMEMLIVLIMSSLLISVMSELVLIVQKTRIPGDEGVREEMLSLYALLRTDIRRADTVRISDEGFTIEGDGFDVSYKADAAGIIRIREDRTDTLSLFINTLKYDKKRLCVSVFSNSNPASGVFVMEQGLPNP